MCMYCTSLLYVYTMPPPRFLLLSSITFLSCYYTTPFSLSPFINFRVSSLSIFKAMSVRLQKPLLNPNAEEWRPTAPAFISGTSLAVSHCTYQGFISYGGSQLLTYFPTFPYPPCGYFHRTIKVSKFLQNLEPKVVNLFGEGTKSSGENQVEIADKQNRRREIPPRFRKPTRAFNSQATKRWQKQEWRRIKPSSSPATDFGDSDSSGNTTVMIKNVPNKLRRGFLLEFLDQHSKVHGLEYDFLYLPMDFGKEGNLGYAFANFTTNEAAVKCKKVLDNYRWQTVSTENGPITSRKVCEVSWARIQGKEALIRRFKNSSFFCEDVEFLPVVLDPPRNGSNPGQGRMVVIGKMVSRSRGEMMRRG